MNWESAYFSHPKDYSIIAKHRPYKVQLLESETLHARNILCHLTDVMLIFDTM